MRRWTPVRNATTMTTRLSITARGFTLLMAGPTVIQSLPDPRPSEDIWADYPGMAGPGLLFFSRRRESGLRFATEGERAFCLKSQLRNILTRMRREFSSRK